MTAGVRGIGIDLVEVDRVRRGVDRHGERFVERVLTISERDYCFGMADPAPHVAVRFAAKEAVAKALGTGIGAGVHLNEIGVVRNENGAPSIELSGDTAATVDAMGGGTMLISLSHTKDHAIAQAMWVGGAK